MTLPDRLAQIRADLAEHHSETAHQLDVLRAADVSMEQLFALDVMVAGERRHSRHAEDVEDDRKVCGWCGALDERNDEVDIFFHPITALYHGIGRDEDDS